MHFPKILRSGSFFKKMVPSGIASTVTGRPSRSAMSSESPQKTPHNSGSADAVTSIETTGLIGANLRVSSVRTKQISVHAPFLMVSLLTVSDLARESRIRS